MTSPNGTKIRSKRSDGNIHSRNMARLLKPKKFPVRQIPYGSVNKQVQTIDAAMIALNPPKCASALLKTTKTKPSRR